MRYSESGLQHGQTAKHVISEEVVGDLILHLGWDHFGVFRKLLSLPLPAKHPLGRGLRKDGAEVD
jgi:hypothetical protein